MIFKTPTVWLSIKSIFKITKANVFREPKQKKHRIIKQIIVIFLITSIIPINYQVFYINKNSLVIALAPGISGCIQLIEKLWLKTSMIWRFYLAFFVINIPIFIFSFMKLGKCLALYTFLIPLFTLFWTLIWQWIPGFDQLGNIIRIKGDNKWIQEFINLTIYGTIVGIIYGLLLKGGATTGGFDTIFTYFSLKKQVNFIKTIKIFNIFTIIIFIIIKMLWEREKFDDEVKRLLIWSIYLVFLITFVMGKIFVRFNLINLNIISNNAAIIKEMLYKNNFIHGGIIFFGKGLYNSDQNREMITTVISMIEYEDVYNIIKTTDANAIIYCTNIHKISTNFISKKYD